MVVGSVRPLFVVGSARAGTTMLGAWLASDPETYDVGEYRAFFLTHRLLRGLLVGMQPDSWQANIDRYVEEAKDHAASFIAAVARDAGCDSYVDSSPRNLLIADELADRFPQALFVLSLRHYSGVIQSLGRTNWDWVPASPAGRAGIWSRTYAEIHRLPVDRTLVVSYDRLCADPSHALAEFEIELAARGIRVERLQRRALGYSYARATGPPRPTLADPTGHLSPIPSVDLDRWTAAIHAEVEPHVWRVDEQLRQAYPQYVEPRDWLQPPGFLAG
jgi:hypothetical protein